LECAALAGLGSALACVRRGLRGRGIASQAKQLDSQLSGTEQQAKAAPGQPGRRIPKIS